MADSLDAVVRTYDVDPNVDVTGALAETAWESSGRLALRDGDAGPHRLTATYFDTPDLRLTRADLSLRRHTAGEEAGWHLVVPAPEGTGAEVRRGPGRAVKTVPAALHRMVRVRSGGASLVPVLSVTTDRTARHLADEDGAVLVRVVDDRVAGRRLRAVGGATDLTVEWRQVRAELVDGDLWVLDALDARLRARGAQHPAAASPMARMLGPELAEPVKPWSAGPGASAGSVVLAYVAAQVEQMMTYDPLVRLDHPDSVHKMRVASRRLRTALKTYRMLFDDDTIGPPRGELKWLARRLGQARDAEVLRDRLTGEAADHELDGPAAAEADARLSQDYCTAHDRLLADLDAEHYHDLVRRLRAFVDDPPCSGRADQPAHDVLPARVQRDYRALVKQVRAGLTAPQGAQRDRLLHEARKRAKRTRYAAEAAIPTFGDDAARFAAGVEELQEVLGEHQDSVVARSRLRDLAGTASSTGAAFGYGRLHAREETRGEQARQRCDEVWERASQQDRRRWLG